MDLKKLEHILRIAEEKNISRAAERLFISQPALNLQLLNLERELGTKLFVRKGNECSGKNLYRNSPENDEYEEGLLCQDCRA